MAESRDRSRASERRIRTAQVLQTWRVTPRMTRIVLGGEDLADLPAGVFTDEYVKVLFPHAGTAERPAMRSLTVRDWDPKAVELTLDVVDHGVEGLVSPWAAVARPGDEIEFRGPGGAYAPRGDVDWHLLIGDESALPAIARSLEYVPAGLPAYVFVEVADKDEEQLLSTSADLSVVWVHRNTSSTPPGDALVEAVGQAWLPAGVGQAFLHGEAGMVKELRRHLRSDRGIARELLSASGYWRRGATDEGWRAQKADWTRDVEAEEATLES